MIDTIKDIHSTSLGERSPITRDPLARRRQRCPRRACAHALTLLIAWLAVACQAPGQTTAELQDLADQILPRVEALSGLEARSPIEITLQDHAAMIAYVERQLTEELSPEELNGVQATYSTLGLIPDTLDLRALLQEVYAEQVIGYYDPKASELYIIEGVPSEEIRPVLAHELVHALQDQHADLETLISPERGNDRQTAAQAALEGHATLVMFALLLEESAGGPVDLRQLPDIGEQLGPVLEGEHEEFPVFRTAPRIIRESLLFPYIGGSQYVQVLWNDLGPSPAGEADTAALTWPAPLDSLLPVSTRQVMHPRSTVLSERIDPIELCFESDDQRWTILYENTLGQLEIEILLAEHLGEPSRTAATGWAGDRFQLLETPEGARVFIGYTLWEDEAEADDFASTYRELLDGSTPERHGSVERMTIGRHPAVRVIDTEASVSLEEIPLSTPCIDEDAESSPHR